MKRGNGHCKQISTPQPSLKHLKFHLVLLILGEVKGREPRCPGEPSPSQPKDVASNKSTPAADGEGNGWMGKRPFDFYYLTH